MHLVPHLCPAGARLQAWCGQQDQGWGVCYGQEGKLSKAVHHVATPRTLHISRVLHTGAQAAGLACCTVTS